MFNNYLIIAWRNLLRLKAHALINILGLTLGIVASLGIFLIVSYEYGFDKFHSGHSRIYRMLGIVTESTGDRLSFGKVPIVFSEAGRRQLSGLEEIATAIPYNSRITVGDGEFSGKQFESKSPHSQFVTTAVVDPQFFRMFKYRWLAGSPTSALTDPFSVVITESRAKIYFGPGSLEDMIGKKLIFGDSLSVRVTGIIKDWEQNSDLLFSDFISFSSLDRSPLRAVYSKDSWDPSALSAWTFIKLDQNTKVSQIKEQLAQLNPAGKDHSNALELSLEPISSIHFNRDLIENTIRTAHRPTLLFLMMIGIFILALAVINFINLSSAGFFQRAKEAGVRKVLGSPRLSVFFHFLTESFLLTSFAVLLAIFLINPVISAYKSFLPAGFKIQLFDLKMMIFLGSVTVFTSILAAIYPAKALSSMIPAVNLKESGQSISSNLWWVKKSLIVFQLTISILFIIASLVTIQQLKFTRDKDLGFDPQSIIHIDLPGGTNAASNRLLMQNINAIKGVELTASQWLAPMSNNPRGMKLKILPADDKDFWVTQIAGDENFIPLYDIKIIAGRNLVKADSVKELVINEHLSGMAGFDSPMDAIGKILYWNDKPYPVVGVVRDFHTHSLHDPQTPLCIIHRPEREGTLAIKIELDKKHASGLIVTLKQIEQSWKSQFPGKDFNFRIFDQTLALLYEKDRQTGILMKTAMMLALLISCMGLFGLSMFMVQKRSREMSIRKILGANMFNIITILSSDFLVLVLPAFMLAAPLAWYLMNNWLREFAYRIDMPWWVFIFAGMFVLVLTGLTVGIQAFKAAFANPVIHLRSE